MKIKPRLFIAPSMVVHVVVAMILLMLGARMVTTKLRAKPPADRPSSIKVVISDPPPRPPPVPPVPPNIRPPVVPPPISPPRQAVAPSHTGPRIITNPVIRRPIVRVAATVPTNRPPVRVINPRPADVPARTNTLQTDAALTDFQDSSMTMAQQLEANRTNALARMRGKVGTLAVAPKGPTDTGSGDHIDAGFLHDIRSAIFTAWVQPVNVTGKCTVSFRLNRNGTVAEAKVSAPSGIPAWDAAALAAVKVARYPPFPNDLGRDSLEIAVPFEAGVAE